MRSKTVFKCYLVCWENSLCIFLLQAVCHCKASTKVETHNFAPSRQPQAEISFSRRGTQTWVSIRIIWGHLYLEKERVGKREDHFWALLQTIWIRICRWWSSDASIFLKASPHLNSLCRQMEEPLQAHCISHTGV